MFGPRYIPLAPPCPPVRHPTLAPDPDKVHYWHGQIVDHPTAMAVWREANGIQLSVDDRWCIREVVQDLRNRRRQEWWEDFIASCDPRPIDIERAAR